MCGSTCSRTYPGDRAWRYDKAQYPSLLKPPKPRTIEVMKTNEKLYFAYGSNMNLNQMAFRCPDAEVVDTVRLEGYRLAFCMNARSACTIFRQKEAVWMASCGGSPNRMNSIWTITRDSPIYMGRNLSP